MLDRTGIVRRGSSAIVARARQALAEDPRQARSRGTSARGPDTTWSARRWIVMTAWSRLSSPPASIADDDARATGCRSRRRSRSRRPRRSASSPRRRGSGRRTARRRSRRSPRTAGSCRSRRRPRGSSVEVHQVGRGQPGRVECGPGSGSARRATISAEQDDALDHRRDARRLDLAAGQDQRPEQDRGDDDPERPEPGEVGDDDRGEAVARRDVVLQPVDRRRRPRSSRPARPARPR